MIVGCVLLWALLLPAEALVMVTPVVALAMESGAVPLPPVPEKIPRLTEFVITLAGEGTWEWPGSFRLLAWLCAAN